MALNIKKLIGFIFLIHAGYSIMKYRKFLTFNNRIDDFSIPIDVIKFSIF